MSNILNNFLIVLISFTKYNLSKKQNQTKKTIQTRNFLVAKIEFSPLYTT